MKIRIRKTESVEVVKRGRERGIERAKEKRKNKLFVAQKIKIACIKEMMKSNFRGK